MVGQLLLDAWIAQTGPRKPNAAVVTVDTDPDGRPAATVKLCRT